MTKHTEGDSHAALYGGCWSHLECNVETGEEIDRKFDKRRATDMSIHDLHKNKPSQGLHERSKNPILRIKRLPEI